MIVFSVHDHTMMMILKENTNIKGLLCGPCINLKI